MIFPLTLQYTRKRKNKHTKNLFLVSIVPLESWLKMTILVIIMSTAMRKHPDCKTKITII